MPKPSRRKIESALIELLREEGFEIEQEAGESFVTVYTEPLEGDDDYKREISLADFAQQLEERL